MLVRSVGLRGGGAFVPAAPDYGDDFEGHAVGSGLPSGWAQSVAGAGTLNPAWSVTDSAPLAGAKSLLGVAPVQGQRGIILTGSSLLDGELNVLVRASGVDNSQMGVVARVTDGDNWIGARISCNTQAPGKIMELYQALGGNFTHDSDAYAFALNTTYRLKLVLASGIATFTAYDTGDNLLATTSLSVSVGAGAVGLWLVGAANAAIKYDNFTASKA